MTINIPQGLSIQTGSSKKRVLRSPDYTFNLRHKPFQIQPFMVAPVLAGETLKNLLLQARVVTDPVRNRLIGWWVEHYFFYVKLTDMEVKDEAKQMLLDITKTMTPDPVPSPAYYHVGGVNWLKEATKKVVKEYFRDENDSLEILIDGLYTSQINQKSWLDSVYPESDMPQLDIDGTTNPIDMGELQSTYDTWQYMRNHAMTEMTFEDYLSSFGVRGAVAEKEGRPELVRFVRNWSYPTNTIADDGSASSAVSWSVTERGDKDRFFKEPGFLVGFTVCRPKVYLSNQTESASHLLDTAFNWLPATMKDDVHTSLKRIEKATGLLSGVYDEEGYWVDVRDLFVYGDQFVNYSLDKTDAGLVALPVADHNLARYPTKEMVDALFVGENGGIVEQDGIVRLNILGTQQDYT